MQCNKCGGTEFGGLVSVPIGVVVCAVEGVVCGVDDTNSTSDLNNMVLGERPDRMWCQNDDCEAGFAEFDPATHPNILD
jgi:hypothetical protein